MYVHIQLITVKAFLFVGFQGEIIHTFGILLLKAVCDKQIVLQACAFEGLYTQCVCARVWDCLVDEIWWVDWGERVEKPVHLSGAMWNWWYVASATLPTVNVVLGDGCQKLQAIQWAEPGWFGTARWNDLEAGINTVQIHSNQVAIHFLLSPLVHCAPIMSERPEARLDQTVDHLKWPAVPLCPLLVLLTLFTTWWTSRHQVCLDLP